MPHRTPKVLLHTAAGERRPIDPSTIYFVEAAADDSLIHRRTSRGLRATRDVRPLAEIERALSPHGFIRIHASYLIDPTRVALIRKRTQNDWELKLTPPSNQLLPISRGRLKALWAAY